LLDDVRHRLDHGAEGRHLHGGGQREQVRDPELDLDAGVVRDPLACRRTASTKPRSSSAAARNP